MTTDEVLQFLRDHQPLPPEDRIAEETIGRLDEVIAHFEANPDEQCVPLLLGALGAGTGLGTYHYVVNVVRTYPPEVVVPALDLALGRDDADTRVWALQAALGLRASRLPPHFRRSVDADDSSERYFAAANLRDTATRDDLGRVKAAIAEEDDADVREVLREVRERVLRAAV